MSTPTAQDHRLEQTPTPTTTPVTPDRGPRHPRLRHFLRVLRTVVVVVALLAAAVAGGNYIIRQRLAAQAYVDLGGAVLTAEAVSVGSPDAGVVTDVKVTEQSQVRAGQELARVMLTSAGTDKPQFQDLRAPTAGTVAALDVPVGGVAKAGEPVVILYDQTKLTFQAQVTVNDLRKLRIGMTAAVRGPGLTSPIAARLDHAVPHVGPDPLAGTDRITVVLVPEPGAVAAVSKLVPGLQFRATVDTRTAVGGTPAVNSAR